MPRLVASCSSALLAATALLFSSGCGPAFRFRPPEVLPTDTIEVGVGLGAAARMDTGYFGGTEFQAFVRGGVADRLEFGGRLFTHTFSSVGGAFDWRVQVVRGPFDLTVEGSFLGGGCCGIGEKNRTLAGALGFDVGLAIGKRFGWGLPAIYTAPHVQVSWTFPIQQSWPKQLFIPVGIDVPLGRTPLSIRPELVVVGLFYSDQTPNQWRVGAGVAFAVTGPDVARIKSRQRRRSAAERRAMEEPPEADPHP
jgi:hypothetical protein